MVKNKLKKLFRSYSGRHFFSRWGRRFADYPFSRQLLSLSLIVMVFSSTLLNSQALAYVEILQAENMALQNQPIETATKTSFQFPLKEFNVSQGFSWHHWGVDLAAPLGAPVLAIADGEVLEAKTGLGYGQYVLLIHQNESRSLYAHLSKIKVTQGRKIKQGEIVGLVGLTGWSSGPHLHLEIRQKGLPLDPFEVLPEK